VSTLTRPRGPLSPRVYWTRRLLVIGTALALVVGIARLLTPSSDGRAPDEAQQVAAQASASGTAAATGDGTKKKRKHKKKKDKTPTPAAPTPPVLAVPTGPCTSSDVVVTPTLTEATAGAEVLVTLELTTRVAEACTWTVSPETLTMKITSGPDDIWSSRQCPAAIPTREVVVRRAVGSKLGVRWSGRRSDDDCSALTEWARPGYYHVVAAALAGEPSDLQVELVKPPRPVVTVTITPSPTPGGGQKKPDKPGR
jgi:hypothetical protein